MLEEMSTLEKLKTMDSLLNQLIESKGRERCAQICVMGDLIDLLRKDVLILEDKVKSYEQTAEEKPAENDGKEVLLETVEGK